MMGFNRIARFFTTFTQSVSTLWLLAGSVLVSSQGWLSWKYLLPMLLISSISRSASLKSTLS